MDIPLPNGDVLILDAEFAEKLNVTRRTLGNLDGEGCPFVMIGGRKYRPLNEGLTFGSHRASGAAIRPAAARASSRTLPASDKRGRND